MPRNFKSKKGEAIQDASLYVAPQDNQKSSSRPKRRKMNRVAKIMLMFFGSYLLFSFLVGGYQIRQVKKGMNQLKAQQEVLLQQQKELEGELSSLQNPEIIEKLARESLGMVKSGEILVVPAVPEENIPKPKNVKAEDIQD